MTKTAVKKIAQFAPCAAPQADAAPLRIVIVGHVDHGKSTLVGRLLHDTGSLPEGKLEQIKASSEKRGMPFEWSFLMDALQTERDQGITIDTTQIWFKSKNRPYCIIDAPGHKEFLKNMISGAASSEAALVLIDAKEGVKEQSKRHGYLLSMLGVKQIAVLVNKMDMVGYDEATFRTIEKEYTQYLKQIGVTPTFIIPISARVGDNIVSNSEQMKWYKCVCVTDALDSFKPTPSLAHLPLRFAVQDVYKFDERRIIAGRIESGSLKVGDEVLLSPSNMLVKVKSFEQWPEGKEKLSASAGESVGITFTDQIFVERGQIISHEDDAPIISNQFRASIFWLGQKPLTVGARYKAKLATSEFSVEVKAIEKVVDTGSLSSSASASVEKGCIAKILLRARGLHALDSHSDNSRMGRFVILDGFDVCGGGIIDLDGIINQRMTTPDIVSTNITALDLKVTPLQRAQVNGHTGGIIWMTGLSGSGKSTLALELQQQLFAKGYQVYVLDGDNIRFGLNRDLGFTAADRSENIRRVGEVAALFAQSGTIVITSFISPYREDRRRARLAAPEYFHSVYIKADVSTCEKRDVKGLYKRARSGEIKDFTGVSAPYEAPENPDLTIDTSILSVDESVRLLLQYVEHEFVEPAREQDRFDEKGNLRDFLGSDI
jgi:bifunctional enzyme CysN/CysC